MRRYLRLLLCLPLFATTACAADAIAGPELAPEPEPEAVAQAAPASEAGDAVVPAPDPTCRGCARRIHPPTTEPLIIIDGVPASLAQAKALEADQVDSIEVLKGASTEALYGRLLPNGVVIITTRGAASRRR